MTDNYLVALISSEESISIKFKSDGPQIVEGSVTTGEIGQSEEKLESWLSSDNGKVQVSIFNSLRSGINYLLSEYGYPSIIIRKFVIDRMVSMYQLISNERNLVVAGFTVDAKSIKFNPFCKCFVLNREGGNKRIMGTNFNYFLLDILKYCDLAKVVLLNSSVRVEDLPPSSTLVPEVLVTTSLDKSVEEVTKKKVRNKFKLQLLSIFGK